MSKLSVPFAIRTAFVTLAALIVLGGAWPGRAHGFCRAVTVKSPLRYDVVANGCFDGPAGTAPPYLYWRPACVSYSLQQDASAQVPFTDATRIAAAAFAAWAEVDCGGGRLSVVGKDLGPAACTEVGYDGGAANQNLIVFRDTGWPADATGTLALTWTTFHTTTGELVDADIEIDATVDATNPRRLSVTRPAPAGTFDLQSILTHEAGHFLGLAHSGDGNAIMYALYAPGSGITADDVAGICSIYPANGMRGARAGAVAGGACEPTPQGGLGSGCHDPAHVTAAPSGGCALAPGPRRAGGLGALALALLLAAGRRRRRTLAAGAALLVLVAAGPARASVSFAALFDELLRDASAVAVVTPLEQRSAWEGRRIYTHTRVRVDRMAAGAAPRELWVRTRGGIVGELGQNVEGEAVFTLGRPALVFLRPGLPAGALGSVYEVAARAQGQFAISADTAGVRRLAAMPAGLLLAPGSPGRARAARDLLAGLRLDQALDTIASAWRTRR